MSNAQLTTHEWNKAITITITKQHNTIHFIAVELSSVSYCWLDVSLCNTEQQVQQLRTATRYITPLFLNKPLSALGEMPQRSIKENFSIKKQNNNKTIKAQPHTRTCTMFDVEMVTATKKDIYSSFPAFGLLTSPSLAISWPLLLLLPPYMDGMKNLLLPLCSLALFQIQTAGSVNMI